MQEINFQINRDGQPIWFEEAFENTYEIKAKDNYVLDYARFIFDELNDDAPDYDDIINDKKIRIIGFDPSGGPMIYTGEYKINDKPVKRICVNKETKQIYFKV